MNDGGGVPRAPAGAPPRPPAPPRAPPTSAPPHHTPERSGWPSAIRGIGVVCWAARVTAAAATMAAIINTRFILAPFVLFRVRSLLRAEETVDLAIGRHKLSQHSHIL